MIARRSEHLEAVFLIEVVDGAITQLYAVRNPDKLAAITAPRIDHPVRRGRPTSSAAVISSPKRCRLGLSSSFVIPSAAASEFLGCAGVAVLMRLQRQALSGVCEVPCLVGLTAAAERALHGLGYWICSPLPTPSRSGSRKRRSLSAGVGPLLWKETSLRRGACADARQGALIRWVKLA